MNIVDIIVLQHWLGIIFWMGVTLLAVGFLYCIARVMCYLSDLGEKQ